jgi:hypothetical protein
VSEQLPRSPYDSVGGLVFFPRMLDKIRLHARGDLPEAYHNNLGREFDGHCLTFLHIEYAALRERVLAGGSDEEILEWCFTNGRRPSTGEIDIFNGFMQKAGWRDPSSERLGPLLERSGLAHLDRQCATRFDFIDFDEGRTPPDFRKWEPPRLS